MKNYNNSKIYKIEPICEHNEGDIYIGSTTKKYLCERMSAHKYHYKKCKEGMCNKFSCFDMFDKYGIDNIKIVLIELVNANSKNDLLEREAYYIKTLKCVNKNIPNRKKNEYLKNNKDKIYEQKQQYREKHKDKMKACWKNYNNANKEKIKEYQKLYREKQKLLKLKKTI